MTNLDKRKSTLELIALMSKAVIEDRNFVMNNLSGTYKQRLWACDLKINFFKSAGVPERIRELKFSMPLLNDSNFWIDLRNCSVSEIIAVIDQKISVTKMAIISDTRQ